MLSTCNRTEVYGVSAEPARAGGADLRRARRRSPASRTRELAPALYTVSDEAAAVHLFRVAAGLDSMVPGEAQILGQVREAYEAARATTRPARRSTASSGRRCGWGSACAPRRRSARTRRRSPRRRRSSPSASSGPRGPAHPPARRRQDRRPDRGEPDLARRRRDRRREPLAGAGRGACAPLRRPRRRARRGRGRARARRRRRRLDELAGLRPRGRAGRARDEGAARTARSSSSTSPSRGTSTRP